MKSSARLTRSHESSKVMNPRTAARYVSIWRDLPEETFRKHMVDLEERTNAVPMDAQQFANLTSIDKADDYPRKISLIDEQSLADAFAFLGAVEEGAQSVSAVCVEEDLASDVLTVRFAAVDAISDKVRHQLLEIQRLLSNVASTTITDQDVIDLLHRVTKLHFRRILGRLRSSKWTKPAFLSRSHKKPLWQDFANLTHRVQFLYTKRELSLRQALEQELAVLAQLYSSFETTASNSVDEFEHVIDLITASYNLCTSDIMKDYAQRLTAGGQTSQVRSAIKTLRQIEKIAAYYRVSNTICRATQRYPQYFRESHLCLEFLPPYASIPTAIGYEEWAKTCHVHAEIQLVVYYDLNHHYSTSSSTCWSQVPQSKDLWPRVIGTSKYLCYLCYLFIKAHGRYPPANTHGRLYDQWTIPDLVEYDTNQRDCFKDIVRAMDEELVAEASNAPVWRPEPMTSRENLLAVNSDDSSNAMSRSTPSYQPNELDLRNPIGIGSNGNSS